MGAFQVSSAADPAAAAGRAAASPVELVECAVGQVLREETAVEALPTILGRLAELFGCRAALAFQQDAGQDLVILAAHPRQAGADRALRAEICALSAEHGDAAAEGGFFQAQLRYRDPPGGRPGGRPGGQPISVLVGYSRPDAGRCLCAVALVGDDARWNADSRATSRAIAAH